MAMAEKEKAPRTSEVARWDPFEDLDAWRPFRFGRLFESGLPRRLQAAEFVPAVDVSEDDDTYVITAEVPGASKDDVTLEIHDNVLTLRGEKRSEREEKKEQVRYVERSFGSFSRSFTLPADSDPNQVKAEFKDGVLRIEVRKAPEAKPKVISIR
jgi:HSP20 family protein